MKEIPLSQGKVALVDDDMFDYLNQWKWCAHKDHYTYYAQRREGNRIIHMHRLVLNAQKGQFLDHKNPNGLDNRKSNLRFATSGQNNQNSRKAKGQSSQYKGVCWRKRNQKWRAQITLYGKCIHLGYYYNEIVAAWVYDQMAIKLFGEFARVNVLSNPYV